MDAQFVYWLLRLRQRYQKTIIAKHTPDRVDRILSAIGTIEQAHRPVEWRLVEYVLLLLQSLRVCLFGRLTNYSIGWYQYKISIMLDSFHVPFATKGKTLFLEMKSLQLVWRLLVKRNDRRVFEAYLDRRFPQVLLSKELDRDCLHDFALDYSRSVAFKGDVNYLSVLRFLISDSIEWKLFHADSDS